VTNLTLGLLIYVGVLMGLVIQRFVVAVRGGDGAGRDHCEQLFAILTISLVMILLRL
jgi:hypothetical protein